jgi:flavin-dependent dehydrogenase
MTVTEQAEIAIAGGGTAGAALAIHLAAAGRDVVLFERRPVPRWRAAGVYTSPRTRGWLGALGLDAATLDAVLQPIRAIDVGTADRDACRLEHDPPYASGVDRVALDQALLERARAAGVCVHEGSTVREVGVQGGRPRLEVADPDGSRREWRARTVVGADGPRSIVARAVGVDRGLPWFRRAGLTVHRADPHAPPPGDPAIATMTLGDGWYCGIAPVPAGRVNIGVVVPADTLKRELVASRPTALVQRIVRELPGPAGPSWRDGPDTDELAIALPLAHRPRRLAGPGWLLVGDAAGFLDPLSGEGIQRALVSAALAADALTARGRGAGSSASATERYHRRMRARYRAKDLLSWLLQVFFTRPELVRYALARLERRPDLARTFNAVLTDRTRATRALDPRFLARVLAP